VYSPATANTRSAGDANALGEARQMRRSVQAGALPARPQRRFDHRRRRALAVGSGHVHHAQPRVRIADAVQQRPHRIQSRPHTKPPQPQQALQQLVVRHLLLAVS
jgi:hypothetical protein